ncbi:MAG: hypothetical protein Kow0031_07100 [Anaerolineae bacterium]
MSDKILLYGDYQSMRVLLLFWLETLLPEKQIIVAEDIYQAVTLAQQHRPRLVVLNTDSFSPVEIETIRQLRQNLPGAPIVVLTNNGISGLLRDALLAGADICVSVDVFREQIQPILQTLIHAEMAPGYRGDLQI